jgi:hypothetical protein
MEPDAVATMRAIAREERLMHADPAAGIAALWQRMRARPAAFAAWYAFGKPWLLWDWDIRIGVGDIYFLQYRDSPFERSGPLRTLRDALRAANPSLFALAVITALATLASAWRRRGATPVEALLTAALFVFVTAVHTVFQAEPRYAIPYRPLQLLLVVAALAMAWRALRARVGGRL